MAASIRGLVSGPDGAGWLWHCSFVSLFIGMRGARMAVPARPPHRNPRSKRAEKASAPTSLSLSILPSRLVFIRSRLVFSSSLSSRSASKMFQSRTRSNRLCPKKSECVSLPRLVRRGMCHKLHGPIFRVSSTIYYDKYVCICVPHVLR